MHNYTVGNRFTTKTRVGNWYQQKQLDDFRFKQYLYNKDHMKNQTLNTKTKLGFSNQARELTPLSEGSSNIYYGDFIALGNQHIEGVLSFNVNESILGEETYAVTTSKNMKPALRNVFRLAYAGDEETDGILRYGDKIRFQADGGTRKLYLQSIAVSPMRSSKFSRNQEVSVTTAFTSSSLWTIQHYDPKLRFDCKGLQIAAGDIVLIKHCLTCQWLASDKVPYVNDFGQEFQVFGKSFVTNNKTQNLFSEKVGHTDVQTPLRNQDLRNGWRILKGKP